MFVCLLWKRKKNMCAPLPHPTLCAIFPLCRFHSVLVEFLPSFFYFLATAAQLVDLSICPGDISVDSDPQQNSATVTWTAPTFVNASSTRNSSDTFHIGTTRVWYYNTTHSCSFQVTVAGECLCCECVDNIN